MKVSDLFDVEYGQSLSLNKMRRVDSGRGVAFVSRTARNNGVSAWVEPVASVRPLPAGLLTVSLRSRNHALATFVQPRDFYCGYHIYVLTPKRPMSLQEKLWWAGCIRANRYRYNFGRQANRSLPSLELPSVVPEWVNEADVPKFNAAGARNRVEALQTDSWRPFLFDQLFDLRRGRNILKRNMRPGPSAYVGASATHNGLTAWLDELADFPGGQITVSSNGSVGEAFYQPRPFVASADVTVLLPKEPLTDASGLFLCTLIRAEKYRWNYGRKWGAGRMRESVLRLPVTPAGSPDWMWMERYVRSLPLYDLVREAD